MAEGMDVLIEQRTSSGYEYLLTNVEYTDFAQKGLQDRPCKEGEPYSIYPSNTNILFADLEAISGAIAHNPFPGMLLNMKTKMESYTRDGQVAFVDSGRLETTMQNIADSWPVQYAQKPSPDELADLPDLYYFQSAAQDHFSDKIEFSTWQKQRRHSRRVLLRSNAQPRRVVAGCLQNENSRSGD